MFNYCESINFKCNSYNYNYPELNKIKCINFECNIFLCLLLKILQYGRPWVRIPSLEIYILAFLLMIVDIPAMLRL